MIIHNFKYFFSRFSHSEYILTLIILLMHFSVFSKVVLAYI